jgi:RNA polymerase sigma-70 factor (ECF subfamily)
MAFGENFPAILAAARTGSEWAWAEIFGDLAEPVLGYLRAKNAHDPENVLGEVFLQVARDVSRFEGDERDFRSWVFTVAHNRLQDSVRYEGRRPVDYIPDDRLASSPAPPDVEQAALAAEAAGRVRRLIDRLTPDQQSVLLLRLFGEMTVEEVARALGKRPGAVKALQRRALKTIKKEISRESVPL